MTMFDQKGQKITIELSIAIIEYMNHFGKKATIETVNTFIEEYIEHKK